MEEAYHKFIWNPALSALVKSGRLAALPRSQIAVVLVLAAYADEKGSAYPSVKTIGKHMGLGRRIVQIALRALCEDRIIEPVGKPEPSQPYRFVPVPRSEREWRGASPTTRGGAPQSAPGAHRGAPKQIPLNKNHRTTAVVAAPLAKRAEAIGFQPGEVEKLVRIHGEARVADAVDRAARGFENGKVHKPVPWVLAVLRKSQLAESGSVDSVDAGGGHGEGPLTPENAAVLASLNKRKRKAWIDAFEKEHGAAFYVSMIDGCRKSRWSNFVLEWIGHERRRGVDPLAAGAGGPSSKKRKRSGL